MTSHLDASQEFLYGIFGLVLLPLLYKHRQTLFDYLDRTIGRLVGNIHLPPSQLVVLPPAQVLPLETVLVNPASTEAQPT